MQEQLRILAEGKAAIKRIMQRSFEQSHEYAEIGLEDEEDDQFVSLKKALSKISLNDVDAADLADLTDAPQQQQQQLRQVPRESSDIVKRARSLSVLASMTRKEIQEADVKVEVAEKRTQELVRLAQQEMRRAVQERHNQLVVATKELVEKGQGEGREGQVLVAVEQVSELMEMSVSLLPSSREGAVVIGGNPWKEGEPEVPRPGKRVGGEEDQNDDCDDDDDGDETQLTRMAALRKQKIKSKTMTKGMTATKGRPSLLGADDLTGPKRGERKKSREEENASEGEDDDEELLRQRAEKKKYESIVKNIVQDFEMQLVQAKVPKCKNYIQTFIYFFFFCCCQLCVVLVTSQEGRKSRSLGVWWC